MTIAPTRRRVELTFKHNLERGRHGWLRLTPAYSVKLVSDILGRYHQAGVVLDPFSGSGTTGLVCAELGLRCDLLELNPFLTWLATVKLTNYSGQELDGFLESIRSICDSVVRSPATDPWLPPLANIERWWAPDRLDLLANIHDAIHRRVQDQGERDLALVAFCWCVISWSNAAFNHQSMSFKDDTGSLLAGFDRDVLLSEFSHRARVIAEAARLPLSGEVAVREADSRSIPDPSFGPYDLVVTSPPYPNRMSYIRELRPYMYWLRYLTDARQAGELDWRAIGGTWGIATSRMQKWEPEAGAVPYDRFLELVGAIRQRSDVLGRYVHKYFVDMTAHFASLRRHVKPGGTLHYIVGNSKFFDTVVPVEAIFAAMMQNAGFSQVRVTAVRKRNSKKELFEFDVSATA